MKFKAFFVSLLSIITASCQSFLTIPDDPGYQAIFQFAKEVKETDDLKLIGFGGGVNSFNLTFMGNQNLDMHQARFIFYDISTRFLERINADVKLREPSLDNIYTIENLKLHFMFPDVVNYITGIFNGVPYDQKSQIVYFFTYNPELAKSKITYQEPYEQLKSIVEQQRGL